MLRPEDLLPRPSASSKRDRLTASALSLVTATPGSTLISAAIPRRVTSTMRRSPSSGLSTVTAKCPRAVPASRSSCVEPCRRVDAERVTSRCMTAPATSRRRGITFTAPPRPSRTARRNSANFMPRSFPSTNKLTIRRARRRRPPQSISMTRLSCRWPLAPVTARSSRRSGTVRGEGSTPRSPKPTSRSAISSPSGLVGTAPEWILSFVSLD